MTDWLVSWANAFLDAHPQVDRFLEEHLHAFGLHGPAVRHALTSRVLPGIMVLLVAFLAGLVAGLAIRVSRRLLGRQRPVEAPAR